MITAYPISVVMMIIPESLNFFLSRLLPFALGAHVTIAEPHACRVHKLLLLVLRLDWHLPSHRRIVHSPSSPTSAALGLCPIHRPAATVEPPSLELAAPARATRLDKPSTKQTSPSFVSRPCSNFRIFDNSKILAYTPHSTIKCQSSQFSPKFPSH